MATADVSIKKALRSQEDVKDRREHCSADPRTLAAIGCAAGQQLRVRFADEYALYTVAEVRDEQRDGIVRIGLTGRRRLATDDEFDGVIDAQVVHPTLTESDAEARGEFIERLEDDGSQSALIVIAPHGGAIERHTDEQAERVRSRLAPRASSWVCKGWKAGGGALDRWHITSTDISDASFPRLHTVISRGFTRAVAFHGFDGSEIVIGGGAAAALKEEIRAAIACAIPGAGIVVRVAQPADARGGDDPRNIVNRLAGGPGIQIEQSLEARSWHASAIADAVADVFAAKP